MTRNQLLNTISASEMAQWMALENLEYWKKRIDNKVLEGDKAKKSAALTALLFGESLGVKNGANGK